MIFDARTVRAVEITALLAAPLIIWFVLYAVACCGVALRPILPWMRILRWVGWSLGVALSLTHLILDHPVSFIYGIALGTFSVGLGLPEGWVKRRFAPDLIEPSDAPDGWWPSKPE